MPKKPSPLNPDKDRRAFLRSVLLDSSSTQMERKAALEELEQLLRAVPEPDVTVEPSPMKARPLVLPTVEDFLPKAPAPSPTEPPASSSPEPGHREDADYEEVVVQVAKPAKYGLPLASMDSFRKALRSALVHKIAAGIQQRYWKFSGTAADAEARGHLQDLLTLARNTHRDWQVDQEIAAWRTEVESDPFIWAQAMNDIAGNYQEFRQDVLQREVTERLQRPDLGQQVREILEDALRRSNDYTPSDQAAKYFRLESREALVLDIPGELLQPAVEEIREKRPRPPDPHAIDIRLPYFERVLARVPTVSGSSPAPVDPRPSAPGAPPPILGPGREEQLARLNRMSPRDQAEYIFNNPHAVLEMTASATQALTGPPSLYEVKDGTKVVCVLDLSDYRLVLATVQQAALAIAECKHHSKERCDCWRGYRDQVGYFRDTRGVDSPIAAALTYYWDFVEATAEDRPKKDATMDALQQLTTKIEAIAEQQSSLMDTTGTYWIGRKKGSRILGGK